MNVSGVPWSHLFWGAGLIIIIRFYYDKQIGTYYTGKELSSYTDTLRKKIWFTSGGKGVSDKYHVQLSYTKSKFIIADNGCSIINRDNNKEKMITSLSPGDRVTVTFKSSSRNLTNRNNNAVKIVGLSSNSNQILNPDEVRIADKKDLIIWNIVGIVFIALGTLSYYLRKRQGK